MRQSLAVTGALAVTATAQSASSLTYWYPGVANNPSLFSKHGQATTFPPVASIITSNAATTVFALGCPAPTGAPSSIFNGEYYESCTFWASDGATYSIISSTRHVMHRSYETNQYSMWWTCDYDAIATSMSCDMEVSGNVNDNTGGPVRDAVWRKEPDRLGNVMAFATAELVTTGRFGEDPEGGSSSRSFGVGTESAAATGSGSASEGATATQGSGSGAAVTGSRTTSGSAVTPTATVGAAGRFEVDAVRLAAMVGGAAFAAVAAW